MLPWLRPWPANVCTTFLTHADRGTWSFSLLAPQVRDSQACVTEAAMHGLPPCGPGAVGWQVGSWVP